MSYSKIIIRGIIEFFIIVISIYFFIFECMVHFENVFEVYYKYKNIISSSILLDAGGISVFTIVKEIRYLSSIKKISRTPIHYNNSNLQSSFSSLMRKFLFPLEIIAISSAYIYFLILLINIADTAEKTTLIILLILFILSVPLLIFLIKKLAYRNLTLNRCESCAHVLKLNKVSERELQQKCVGEWVKEVKKDEFVGPQK